MKKIYHKKIYSICSALSPSTRYGITCMMIVTITTSWYYLVYCPIAALQINTSNYQQQKSIDNFMQQSHVQQTTMNQDIDNLKQNIISNFLFQQMNVNQLFNYMQTNKLSITSFSQIASNNKQWYHKKKYHLQTTGTFEVIDDFLKNLVSKNMLVHCKELEITSMPDDILLQLNATISFLEINKEWYEKNISC